MGIAGEFMAIGAGYAEAREMIKEENIKRGYAYGFAAGLLS